MKKIISSYISISLLVFMGVYSDLANASYAYVANSNSDSITLCTDTGIEGLDDCGDSGAGEIFHSPKAIAIPDASFSGNTYAYITNTEAGTISQCQINTADGSLSDDCIDTADIFSSPIGIVFQSTEGILYAYVSDVTTGKITKCTVNASSGVLESCENGVAPFSAPLGMTIQTIGSIDYAYIVNNDEGRVVRCSINSMTGALSDCLDSGMGAAFSTPENIAFFTTDDLYAYITDSTYATSGVVWQCNVDDINGMLSACEETGAGLNQPTGIAFKTIADTDYVYITNLLDNTYTYCEVISDGRLICSTRSAIPSNNLDPMGLAYFRVNGVDYTYVANSDVGTVSQCRIESSGNLYCVDSGVHSIFGVPSSITLYALGSSIFALVVDTSLDVVWACQVNTTTGQFTTCSEQGADTFISPVGIDVSFTSRVDVYVSDSEGIIWRCTASTSNASFSDCESAGDYEDGFNNPRGLLVQDAGISRYVYIINYQVDSESAQIVQCETDGSTGLFTSCVDSGSGFSLAYPDSIVINGLTVYVPEVNSFGGDTHVHKYSLDYYGTGGLTALDADYTGIDGKSGIVFAVAGFTQYVYLTDDDDASVAKCSVDAYGVIQYTSCVDAVVELSSPVNIDIQTVTAYTGAYIVQSNGSIQGCTINELDGSLTVCQDSGAGLIFDTPSDITFQTVSANKYAYITDSGLGTVTRCLQDPDTGALSACTPSGAGAIFGAPTGISFDTLDATIYAYIVDNANNLTYQCELNSSGLFVTDSCHEISNVLDSPLGLGINNNFIYIADVGTNSVIICKPNDVGVLTICKDSGVGGIFLEPADVAFFTDADENLNAYITNADSSCSLSAKNTGCDTTSVNSVTYCSVDTETGLLSDCNDSSLGPAFRQPTGIAFGSSYAYVSNSDLGYNRVFRCILNSNGSFAGCGDSGAGTSHFAQPFGITFFTP